MHVALTYNLKREESDEDESRRSENLPLPDKASAVLSIQKPPSFKISPRRDTFAEWDSVETIAAVQAALELHHNVSLVEANQEACEKLALLRPDIVFNMAEGLHGPSREAHIPALLELLEIPYTGSDPLTLCICLDKARTKEILSYHDIPTASFRVVSNLEELAAVDLKFPLFVKPVHEGSSKGILNSSVVRTAEELGSEVLRVTEVYEQPALIEEYLVGREFTVALLGNGPNLRVLPIIESKFEEFPAGANPINSFEAKWLWDTPERPLNALECPARISSTLQKDLERISREVFEVLRCRDWCRIDFRLDGKGTPNVMDVNPIPGVLPNLNEHSFFPTAAAAAGMTYDEMINAVLNVALARWNHQIAD